MKRDRVRNGEDLYRVKELSILHILIRRRANSIGHILRSNCLPVRIIERKIKANTKLTRRRKSRRKQLLDNLKETRGYWELKEEELDRSL